MPGQSLCLFSPWRYHPVANNSKKVVRNCVGQRPISEQHGNAETTGVELYCSATRRSEPALSIELGSAYEPLCGPANRETFANVVNAHPACAQVKETSAM